MQFHYLGLLDFEQALEFQEHHWLRVKSGDEGCVLGFELQPVITLGARATSEDVLWAEERWRKRGFAVRRADRGGQATIHNPGQLVVFPILNIRDWGVRRFACALSNATRAFLARYGCVAWWSDEHPGLYTKGGKIASLGIRVRSGVSTHGIAINVHNDLEPFGGIRVCGRAGASVDRLSTGLSLNELFSSWCDEFNAQLTSRANSPNLRSINDLEMRS